MSVLDKLLFYTMLQFFNTSQAPTKYNYTMYKCNIEVIEANFNTYTDI